MALAELTSANTTMYAGNTYHLRVQGADPNGWGDIAEVRINLNPINAGDMVIHYTPSNDTAWTDSDWINVLDLVEDGQGAEMRRLDGGVSSIHLKRNSFLISQLCLNGLSLH